VNAVTRAQAAATAACAFLLLLAAGCGRAAPGPAHVRGTWTWVATGHTVVCATCQYRPISLGLGVVGGPNATFHLGRAAAFRVAVSDIGPGPIDTDQPLALPVEIASTAGGQSVWAGVLPAVPDHWSGDGSLSFAWNERDRDGRPVPAGSYLMELGLPLTIHYSIGGTAGQETLSGAGSALSGEVFAVPFRLVR